MRLGLTERGVTEILGVAEHVAGLTAASAALGLQGAGDAGELAAPAEPDPAAAELLAEIAAWGAAAGGPGRVPAFWRLLSHRPRLLGATWAKHRLVLGAGELDEGAKACAALAVACFRQSPYWVAELSSLVRERCGFGDPEMVEVAGAVMHYVSFNTIAHGMRLAAGHDEMEAASFR